MHRYKMTRTNKYSQRLNSQQRSLQTHRNTHCTMALVNMSLLTLALALLLPCCHGQLTSAEKQEALHFSNFLRRNVVPKAGDMNGLLWSDNLANLAQDVADSCKFEHRYDGPYAGLGENLYKGSRRNMSEILMAMFLERENYDFNTGTCKIDKNSKYTIFNTCGHYLQIATANLMYIGCGLKLCDDGNYIAVCEYDRGIASPPYQAGEPGTMCNHQLATYTQNGLCYFKPIGGPAPIDGPLDCNMTCLNYGNKTHSPNVCMCTCPNGVNGMRCERRMATTNSVPNDCRAQLVTCKNGGTPTMTGLVCRCVCPVNYRGQFCEESIPEADNSVFWYFGEDMRYSSYYPVDPSTWTSKSIKAAVQYYMTQELNTYCKANYQTCCVNSPSATTTANFVTYAGFTVTDNYPENMLDGSLKVGVHFRLPDSVARICGGSSAPYVSRKAVLAAAEKAMPEVRTFLTFMGVKAINYE